MIKIIIFTILISTLLNLIFRGFKIPTIIGYIATGTFIAYGFDLHGAANSHDLKMIAEFGVVFLMFTIGLEFSINHLISMKKEVFVYGVLQVVVTAAVFTFLANSFFGVALKSSIIIGSALALSSTAIVLKLLNESSDIYKPYGRKVLGILLFQDMAVIPILLMITIFSVTGKSVSTLLLETMLNALLLLGGLFIVGKYLLEPFFHAVSKAKSNEIFVSSILLIVIGASYIAHLFGFSYSLGAFIAGMMISETHYKHQVEADLIPFRDLLLGIFFITVGMQLDFKIINENIISISMILPIIILLKVLIIYVMLRFENDNRTAIKSAISLFQVGEFALVVFELSFATNILEYTTGQILIVSVIISMIITPFVLKNITQITDIINDQAKKNGSFTKLDTKNMTNHIVLIGYGRLGKYISKLIRKEGFEYVAIENDIQTVKDAQKKSLPVIFGNAAQKNILESVNIKDASAVIISIGNDKKLHHICQVVNDLTHNAKTIVKVDKYEAQKALSGLNLSHIVVETEKTALAMFEEAMRVQ